MSKHVEGATPHGGTSATMYFFDNNKIPVDESVATCCGVAEYDKDGNTIEVTFMIRTPKTNEHATKK